MTSDDFAQVLKPGDVVLACGGEHRMSRRFENPGERLGSRPTARQSSHHRSA